MQNTRRVVAVAGAGSLGRYACEELLAAPDFELVIISRDITQKWFSNLPIRQFATDYTPESLLAILNATHASALLSFIDTAGARFLEIHTALLAACAASDRCKRLVPSEYIGDIESFPTKPDFYTSTRLPFREMLRAQSEVEWTLLNPGFLMDYFIPAERSYHASVPEMFVVDADAWHACVRGTGDELQSWTCSRDIGRALVELCRAERWEQVTYISGEWGTFNAAITTLEKHHGKTLPKSYKSLDEIQSALAAHPDDGNLQVQEMSVLGCIACPKEKTIRQREKFFSKIKFLDLESYLRSAEEKEGII